MTLPFAPIPLPLLVTGVAGVPGYNAFQYFQARYPGQVVGIRQRDNWRLSGEGVEPCDAEDVDTLRGLFDRYRFRSVLDCAGNCALRACELDSERAWRINVGGVQNLLEVIHAVHGGPSWTGGAPPVRLVHLSVDLVFSGNGYGGHVETDPTDPVTVYGETMVASERIVAERYPSACTLRISLPMGVSFNGHAGAIDWIQSRFKKHRPATLYFDEVRTPHYTDCLNELCEVLLAADESIDGGRPPLAGLYHAGGPKPWSLFEIAQVINRVGGYDPDLLMGCPRLHAGPVPPRSGNSSMDTSKLASALGYAPFDPWPLDSAFHPTDRLWHYRRGSEPGSPELLSRILCRNPRRRAP